MNISRILYRSYIRFLERLVLLHPFKSCFSFNLSTKGLEKKGSTPVIDIVVVTFNNKQIFEHQARLIKKYLSGNYNYIVADNSSDKSIRKEIRELCIKNNISYVSLPPNHLVGANSHATALNWIYYKIICRRHPDIFGFIDHDLFPISKVNIAEKISNQPIYGLLRDRPPFWYLFAGLCFFRFNFVEKKKIDFMPRMKKGVYLDTGGSNWRSLYASLNKNKITTFVIEKQIAFRKQESAKRHADEIEYFDDCWLHTINGSYWTKVDNKDDFVNEILKKY